MTTASGIDPEHAGQIFEPYFTTRRTGTGLGLPITRNIVEGLGGAIAVRHEHPGTTVEITLPGAGHDDDNAQWQRRMHNGMTMTNDGIDDALRRRRPRPYTAPAWRYSRVVSRISDRAWCLALCIVHRALCMSEPMPTPGAILLVDDEDKILKTLGRALRADGHRVAEAAAGQAARQLLAAQDFDLVILDNLMPDVSGLDLIREIVGSSQESERPQIVMMTAHATDRARHRGHEARRARLPAEALRNRRAARGGEPRQSSTSGCAPSTGT